MTTININDWNDKEMNNKSYYGLHNNLLSEVSIPSNQLIDNYYIFSNKINNRNKVSNQGSSGRCWMFAGLNVIRHKFIEDLKLSTSFEFSENYLLFWDKLERINYYLNVYQQLDTKNIEINSQLFQHLLKDPLEDGGQWQMFVNLVNKYGLVPKTIFPETKHSSNTRGLNMVLTRKLRDYCKLITEKKLDVKKAMDEVFTLLVKFLGKPPNKFTWEYYDKENKYHKQVDITPQYFYKNTNINLDNYVSITNDPRNEYHQNYGVQYLNNVIEGGEVKYLNLEMDEIKNIVKKSINDNKPVWFGSDVGHFMHSKTHILSKNVFDIENYLDIEFKLTKKDRIELGDSLMTHAMCITGYNLDNYGVINRWEIENSWGNGVNDGYYVMSDKWMNEFVYQVIVEKKYLSNELLQQWDKEIKIRFNPWDPMGSLA